MCVQSRHTLLRRGSACDELPWELRESCWDAVRKRVLARLLVQLPSTGSGGGCQRRAGRICLPLLAAPSALMGPRRQCERGRARGDSTTAGGQLGSATSSSRRPSMSARELRGHAPSGRLGG